MTDILLSHGYILEEDEKEAAIMRPYPPLGLLYLAAYLRDQGFAVEVFDATLSSRRALEDRLESGSPSVLGLYTTLMTRSSVLEIAARAGGLGWTVVVGGPDSANYPHEYLEHGADVVVIGEGELTTAELLQTLVCKGVNDLHGVDGAVFVDSTQTVVTNRPRAVVKDLADLPWPARDMVDVDSYVRLWREHHGRGSVNLITARGCAYRCNWCSHAVFGHTHRRRSPEDCADEVAAIVERYRPEQLWYADDVFTIHHGWLSKYAALLKERDLQLPFETISRADRMMKEDVVATLAEMGCERIWIGAESGSRRILEAMERGVTPEQVEWAAHAARSHGIEVGLFLMWGYEGESFGDIEATVDMVRKIQPDVFFTTLAYPIKNTGYWHKVKDRVIKPRLWHASSDREHGVAGRPGREFYRTADRWLRAAVAASGSRSSNDGTEAEEAAIARAELLAACQDFESVGR